MSWPDPEGPGRFHYAGIGGSGMSALAQFQAMTGGRVSGSERSFDRGERSEDRLSELRLERTGGTYLHPPIPMWALLARSIVYRFVKT